MAFLSNSVRSILARNIGEIWPMRDRREVRWQDRTNEITETDGVNMGGFTEYLPVDRTSKSFWNYQPWLLIFSIIWFILSYLQKSYKTLETASIFSLSLDKRYNRNSILNRVSNTWNKALKLTFNFELKLTPSKREVWRISAGILNDICEKFHKRRPYIESYSNSSHIKSVPR